MMAQFALDILKLLGHLMNGVIFLLTLRARVRDGLSRKVWSKAERIDSGSYNQSHSVHLAFDGHGNALAVSNEYHNVYARYFTPDTGWGKPELIDHTRDSDNPDKEARGGMNNPEAYFDLQGNGLAAWDMGSGYDNENGYMHEAWSNRYSPTTGWGKAERFAHTPGESRAAKMACDMQGNTLAIWTHFADNSSTLWSSRYTDKSGWSKPAPIAQCRGNATLMELSFDPHGNALVLWRTDKEGKNTRGRFSVYAIYYSAVTGWDKANILSKVLDSYHMGTLQFAFDHGGNVIIVCSFMDSTDNEELVHIWAKRYDTNNGWEKAIKIDPGIVSDYSKLDSESVQPRIAFDCRGHAIVVWVQKSGSLQGTIWANRHIPGKGWGKASSISQGDCDDSSHQLAADHRGNAIVIWKQGSGLTTSYYTADVGWSTPENIYPISGQTYQTLGPKIVFNTDGIVVAIWWHQEFLYTTIWSRQYTPGKGWGKLTPVARDYTNKANYPYFKIDARNIAHVIWSQRDLDSSDTHYWTSHILKTQKISASKRK